MPEMALMALILSGMVNPLRKRLEAGVLIFRLSCNREGRLDLGHFPATAHAFFPVSACHMPVKPLFAFSRYG